MVLVSSFTGGIITSAVVSIGAANIEHFIQACLGNLNRILLFLIQRSLIESRITYAVFC